MVQADVVLVSGRYVREVEQGLARNIIPDPADHDVADLITYRLERGLPPRPAVAVLTRTAAFNPAVAAGLSDRVIITHESQVAADTLQEWDTVGLESVHVGRDGKVEVDLLLAALAERRLTVVFSAAGPNVLAMLVPRLDALYLTLGAQLLGGQSYMTVLAGDELVPPLTFTLGSAYLDPHGPNGASQLFLRFDRIRP
jgi:riboflavin biosynthesis pyrimidine reductase